MDADLKRFEEELERFSPESLPEGLITRMEAAMENWEETSSEERGKVVPFRQPGEEEKSKRGRSSLWAAAASVAILGVVAGLLLTGGGPKLEGPAEMVMSNPEKVAEVAFAPQSAKRKILSSSNNDFIIPNGAQPVRMVRLHYVDSVKLRNEKGEEVHVERPAVEYFLIPVPTD